MSNNVATYFPEAGFVGTDTFRFAAWNGAKNSTIATGTVAVAQGPFSIAAKALVPPSYPANWGVPFTVLATPVNVIASPTYDWSFGDGSAHSTNQYAAHRYAMPGSYHWSVTASVQSGVTTATTNLGGTIAISEPICLASPSGDEIQLSWPLTTADALVEETPVLGPEAHWTVTTNAVVTSGGMVSVTVPNVATRFFRLRKL